MQDATEGLYVDSGLVISFWWVENERKRGERKKERKGEREKR